MPASLRLHYQLHFIFHFPFLFFHFFHFLFWGGVTCVRRGVFCTFNFIHRYSSCLLLLCLLFFRGRSQKKATPLIAPSLSLSPSPSPSPPSMLCVHTLLFHTSLLAHNVSIPSTTTQNFNFKAICRHKNKIVQNFQHYKGYTHPFSSPHFTNVANYFVVEVFFFGAPPLVSVFIANIQTSQSSSGSLFKAECLRVYVLRGRFRRFCMK